MKFSLFFGVLFLAILHSCLSESEKDLTDEDHFRSSDSFLSEIQEESRGKKCIERNKECTNDRHGCCRGKIFKDKCECVGSGGKERCVCKQKKWAKIIESYIGDIPTLPKPEDDKCVPKHEDCSERKNDCCKSGLFTLKCKCYDMQDDEDGKKTELCGCVQPFEHKAIEQALRFGKWMVG
uniref:DELTA-miturgitoxin-Cp2a n=1 Tax=Cheiracanthium punctorium TaxID=682790 RepID=TX2A_CHEPU|nr:RecName: Full=DELTA-miturgitoxin-Cp2a; Short=DELTA-MGTX-Cp2a; AltName: Full=Toxin CpTx-2a; AltName: Full=Toxin CpTx1-2a; Flags: Precursor [Cheiracanthium punctorium]AHH30791.1 CpTx-2a toxin precursor [Cheiracanthium punctorium]